MIIDNETNPTIAQLGPGLLWASPDRRSLPIPAALGTVLAPASAAVYEWTEYWLQCPGADALHVGDDWLAPVVDSLFRLRFENALGLVSLQPYAHGKPLSAATHIEVISPKFPDVPTHIAFLQALLDGLFQRAAQLPFSFSGTTRRGVTPSLRPPTPLFVWHFLNCYGTALKAAIEVILRHPHRELRDHVSFVHISSATEAGADSLLGILQHPEQLVHTNRLPLARTLGGVAPQQVWQRQSYETFNTAENRLVLMALRDMQAAATGLPRQPWWRKTPVHRRAQVHDALRTLLEATVQPMFDAVASLTQLNQGPATSRVLLQRDGYRELWALWQVFRQASQPLWAQLQQAIEVRDVATLYEMWVFFALADAITTALGQPGEGHIRSTDETGIAWLCEVRFGAAGTLIYNQAGASYSVALRPDFTWWRENCPPVIFDAKFRLERTGFQSVEGEKNMEATVKQEDLYKMHTYRDALGTRAAVTIYPGQTSIFHDRQRGTLYDVDLRTLLQGDLAGIGAIAMSPVPTTGCK
jgi:hypothetical protein